jgi:hypothetical protein
MTIAYSALGSAGISTSCTLGLCGNADGRGIFFDLLEGFVMNELQSCFSGELAFLIAERVIAERVPVTGRIE